MQAHFAITAAFPEYQVPNASTIAVVVNDSEDADTASFSNPLAVDLLAHASLINPNFFYWSKVDAGKAEQPYAWGFFQIGQTPTRNAQIEDSQAASKPCVVMTAKQTVPAQQDGWLGGFLDQWIEFPNDKFRVPVWPTFRYAGGDTPETVMGIEVRDDTHRLWYIFSDESERIWIDPANPLHAFHLLEAPLNRWSEHTIDLSADYHSLGWPLPGPVIIQKDGRPVLQRMVNFRLFVASQEDEPFSYQGCFGPIIQHLP
jgi:hypothetical protein